MKILGVFTEMRCQYRRVVCGMGALCTAILVAAPDGLAQTGVRLAKLGGDQRWVALVDQTTGASRRIYDVRPPKWAWDLTVAPGQQHFALIERERTTVGPEGSTSYRNELVIVDTIGKPVRRITRDVQRYVWCGETCLAYIEGSYREGGMEFEPKGVGFLLDLATGEERPLPGPTYPYAIRWASFDSSLYLKNAGRDDGFGIYRYHLPTGTLSRTNYLDFDFSPSGRFYLIKAGEASERTRLFDRTSNREVPLPDSSSLGVATGWVFSEGDFLLLLKFERVDPRSTRLPKHTDTVVFDVRSRRVKQRIDGEIQSWSAPPGVVPVVRGGRVIVLSAPVP